MVLSYEDKKASLEVSPESKTELKIKAAISSATGQLLLHLKAGTTCKTAAGGVLSLSDRSIEIRAEDAGGWVEFEGWRINLPAGSKINFPSYPFDPEQRDTRALLSQARGILSYPLNSTVPKTEFTITVLKQ